MRFEWSSLTLMGVIAMALGLIYAAAAFVRSRTRINDRTDMENAMRARDAAVADVADEPLVVAAAPARPVAPAPPAAPTLPVTGPRLATAAIVAGPAHAATSAAPAAQAQPAATKPAPKALIAWTPPSSAAKAKARFTQYITWPGSKVATPVAEKVPTDQDYVWD